MRIRKLFVRDRNVCAYCGNHFVEEDLTREHIIPFAQNGVDKWMNVVTACRPCNHRKSHRTPEQAKMPLLYAPYVPSLWEDFILRNRRILADQMEFFDGPRAQVVAIADSTILGVKINL